MNQRSTVRKIITPFLPDPDSADQGEINRKLIQEIKRQSRQIAELSRRLDDIEDQED